MATTCPLGQCDGSGDMVVVVHKMTGPDTIAPRSQRVPCGCTVRRVAALEAKVRELEGRRCARCGHLPMARLVGGWRCMSCGHQEAIADPAPPAAEQAYESCQARHYEPPPPPEPQRCARCGETAGSTKHTLTYDVDFHPFVPASGGKS